VLSTLGPTRDEGDFGVRRQTPCRSVSCDPSAVAASLLYSQIVGSWQRVRGGGQPRPRWKKRRREELVSVKATPSEESGTGPSSKAARYDPLSPCPPPPHPING
jgi:hypothetical protein